jgi:hypothetical protein
MINEGIHERLAEIYDEFDRHCRITNTKYSIDSDHYNLQGYRILDCYDFKGFLRYICNFVKDKWVDMEVDGVPVNYHDLDKTASDVKRSEEPIFQFTLSAIQEEDMLGESQYKNPTGAHTRKQAQHPSSFRENEPGLSYSKGGKKKRKKKADKSMATKEGFEGKLNSALSEGVGIQFTEPQVLFTRDEQLSHDDPIANLAAAKSSLSGALDQYHYALKHARADVADNITSMIEACASQINGIDKLLNIEDCAFVESKHKLCQLCNKPLNSLNVEKRSLKAGEPVCQSCSNETKEEFGDEEFESWYRK